MQALTYAEVKALNRLQRGPAVIDRRVATKFVKRGWITYAGETTTHHPRYELTDKGQAALAAWDAQNARQAKTDGKAELQGRLSRWF